MIKSDMGGRHPHHHGHHVFHHPRVRGLVLPWILLSLAQGEVHGYQLLEKLVAEGIAVDPGILYRTLRSLEEEGAVSSVWNTEGAGPARRVYRLTDSGWELLSIWARFISDLERKLSNFLSSYERILKEGKG